jgi:predicted anti-sigma-YlaC factor YlaD
VADPRRTECPFEGEVVAAAMAGRSPAEFDAELRAHLGTCSSCREVADVSAFLSAERTEAQAEAHPPSADLVWWRAQRRARLEAARAAEAPVRAAQLVAAIGAVLLVAVAGWWVFGTLGQSLSEMLAHAPALADALRPGAAPLLRGAVVIALLSAVVFLPVALYLTFADD